MDVTLNFWTWWLLIPTALIAGLGWCARRFQWQMMSIAAASSLFVAIGLAALWYGSWSANYLVNIGWDHPPGDGTDRHWNFGLQSCHGGIRLFSDNTYWAKPSWNIPQPITLKIGIADLRGNPSSLAILSPVGP
ncbi:MAG TPA: hypothetical protein VHI52_03955 [Verrucomicrobiae bacterium]|nr:hypothetical protein [Verrucomicrobiae bacterium]HVX83278.1 hypothetical protein [Phycisphaerae bacterium]